MTDFTMTTDADGVATITWDVKQKSMNVMSTEAFSLLSDLIETIRHYEAKAERGLCEPRS